MVELGPEIISREYDYHNILSNLYLIDLQERYPGVLEQISYDTLDMMLDDLQESGDEQVIISGDVFDKHEIRQVSKKELIANQVLMVAQGAISNAIKFREDESPFLNRTNQTHLKFIQKFVREVNQECGPAFLDSKGEPVLEVSDFSEDLLHITKLHRNKEFGDTYEEYLSKLTNLYTNLNTIAIRLIETIATPLYPDNHRDYSRLVLWQLINKYHNQNKYIQPELDSTN